MKKRKPQKLHAEPVRQTAVTRLPSGTAGLKRWLDATEPEDIALALCGAVLLALFPLARGGWDLWSQTLFELVLCGGLAVWCAVKLLRGRVPLPGTGGKIALAVVAAAFLACAVSPVSWVTWRGFKWLAAGLMIFVFTPFAGTAGRRAGFGFLTATGWFLCLLCVYQFFSGQEVTGSYFNPNAFAGFLAMLAPAAFLGGHVISGIVFGLAAGFLGSRAALAGILIALVFYFSGRSGARAKTLAVLGALGTGVWIYLADFSSLGHRFAWWHSAWQMFTLRPLTGFGGGSFEYVYPAVHDISAFSIGSLFAHSWPLELLSEYGIMGFILMAALVLRQTIKAEPPARVALIAVLLVSLQDYVLSVPANFAVFCFFMASGEKPVWSDIRASAPTAVRAACAVLVLAAGFVMCRAAVREFNAEKRYLAAAEQFRSGNIASAAFDTSMLIAREPQYPAPQLLLARLERAEAERTRSRALLQTAAASYERALELNPYHILAYDELAEIYRMTGSADASTNLSARRARYVTWKR